MTDHLRLDVFIGSPKENLGLARRKVIDALLRAGHWPNCMEFWPSGVAPTRETVAEKLESSDIHVLMLGSDLGQGRVGDLSFVEWEFNESEKRHRPVLAFLLSKDALRKELEDRPLKETERKELEEFRTRLEQRAVCTYFDSIDMPGIEAEILLAINIEILEKDRLMPNAGWVRAQGLRVQVIRDITSNPFLLRMVERVHEFRTLTGRILSEAGAKRTVSKLFWDILFTNIRERSNYRHLFFESGSTLTFVSNAFEDKIRETGSDPTVWKVTTNNIYTLLQLMLFTDVDVHRRPPVAPNPLDRYGAMFSRGAINAPEPPPLQPRRLFSTETAVIEDTKRLFAGTRSELILATASGWDTTHGTAGFRGLHVGSHPNMLFKRALFRTGRPVVLFLTRKKIDPNFKESQFFIGKCFPVFGEEDPIERTLSERPVAICVGYEPTLEERGQVSTSAIKESIISALRPVLAPCQFDFDYGSTEAAEAGAFIAANAPFKALIPK